MPEEAMTHINAVNAYFKAWLTKNQEILSDLFSDDILYTECYGPQYRGLLQIQRWFSDWNQRGIVLQWDIKNVLENGSCLCVEWHFRCEYDGVIEGFDGVSWIEFDEKGKIKALREFQSKAEHHFPYEQA